MEIQENPYESELRVSELTIARDDFKDRKKHLRGTWDKDQKKIMQQYFKNHIKKKIAPRKGECLEFKEKYSEKFENKSWLQIKTFIYNSYRVN